ncbi:hypothetical protein BH18VER1_BH18VER1_16570 [soil metagenome]
MAQVFGTSGRNAAQQSHRHTKRLLAYGLAGPGLLALIAGFAFGVALPVKHFGIRWALLVDTDYLP